MREVRRALLALVLASCAALAGCSSHDDVLAGDTCRGREATIVGTDGDDRLIGTAGPDVIVGRDGDDRIRGLGGDDVVCGGAGADRLSGGAGDDELHGELEGHRTRNDGEDVWIGDTLAGGPGDDLLDGGIDDNHPADEGGDTVSFAGAGRGVVVDLARGRATGEGRDELAGSIRHVEGTSQDDRLLGDENANDLRGGDGADELTGRGGDDDLRGLGGADLLYGGPGDDLLGDTVIHEPGQVVDGGPGARDTLVGLAFATEESVVDEVSGTVDLTAGRVTAYSPVAGVWNLELPGVELVSPAVSDTLSVVGTSQPAQSPSASPSASPSTSPSASEPAVPSGSPSSEASSPQIPASPTASP